MRTANAIMAVAFQILAYNDRKISKAPPIPTLTSKHELT